MGSVAPVRCYDPIFLFACTSTLHRALSGTTLINKLAHFDAAHPMWSRAKSPMSNQARAGLVQQ